MTMSPSIDELDDLKRAWQSLDRRVERQEAQSRQRGTQERRARARSGLRPLVIGQLIQAALGLAFALAFASFWVDHLDTPHLAICGALLHAYAVMLLAFAVRDLAMIKRIDYAAPVLEIQKRLANLRAWRLRAGLWFAVAGCFMWTPLLILAFYWMGVDLWVVKPVMVWLYVASSFACLGLSYALLRFSRRPGKERLAKALHDSSVGRSLARALAAVAEVERFERG
jgi:hypothetical protein